ncbi:MAG: phytanoyl-CoA dioxygenase family protein [Pseudomonadota bacterium]
MLSHNQKDQFERYGYLAIESLIDDAALDAIRSEYATVVNNLYEGWYADGKVSVPSEGLSFWEKLDQGQVNQLDVHQPLTICLPDCAVEADSPMHMGPAIFGLVRHQRILDAVEDLIGLEITASPIQHVRIKPPQGAARNDELRAHVVATDWHQDKGVTLAEADDTTMVTVWVAITDATLDNGCLQVARTGPTERLLPHCCRKQVAITEEHLPRPEDIQPRPDRSDCAVIFSPLTPHCSRPIVSDEYRWSFDLRFHVTGQPIGRSQFPEVIVRSAKMPARVDTNWKTEKQRWDETRARLSSGPYRPQHRRDLSNPYCV